MGCFSYICPKCDNPIFSDKYGNCVGEEVHLGLLYKGKIVEEMFGRYTSYGTVYKGKKSFHKLNGKKVTIKTPDCNGSEDTHEWIYKFPDEEIYDYKLKKMLVKIPNTWGKIVRIHFGGTDDGLVAIHEKCWDKKWGTIKSPSDPDQGWRDYENERRKNE